MSLVWTQERIDFLVENYPKKGRQYCIDFMGLSDGQIRMKASRLGLKANGVSDACIARNAAHGKKLTGRKRPDQSIVMKDMFADGRLLRARTQEQRDATSERMKQWLKENGHPRGALGMKHSDETKRIIGEKSKAWSESLTDKERGAITLKMLHTKVALGNSVQPRLGATWKAAWREIGGQRKFYRSRWEANYARYLEMLRVTGHIKSWAHEPKTFWFDGIKRGCVSYLPDFHVVENNGSEAYHEVKGWMDDRSKTKIRRMAKYHPDVKLIVIAAKEYRELDRKLSGVIDGWER